MKWANARDWAKPLNQRKPRKPRKHEEQDDQIKLSAWLTKEGIWHHASPNGEKRPIATAARLKAMGMSKGFPDIFIPLPRGGFHGLFIELKCKTGGKISNEQIEWMGYLREQAYFAEIARGYEEAREVVLLYLSL